MLTYEFMGGFWGIARSGGSHIYRGPGEVMCRGGSHIYRGKSYIEGEVIYRGPGEVIYRGGDEKIHIHKTLFFETVFA